MFPPGDFDAHAAQPPEQVRRELEAILRVQKHALVAALAVTLAGTVLWGVPGGAFHYVCFAGIAAVALVVFTLLYTLPGLAMLALAPESADD